MRFVDLIEKKRDRMALTKEEILFWIDHYVKGEVPDYQVSSLLMAIVLNGMNAEETVALTMAMMNSGDVFDLSRIQGIKVDKHSTGGVGDKTSLVLGPMVAAAGAKVAKMSGRGLGHTGGTIDKLESIPGFHVELTEEQFIKQVNEIGLAIIGQSAQLVPADKKLYALRDVTGTVPAIPLIASSIMSKKLAAGSDAILLDVKYGDGAFMQTPQRAIELAKAMISIGNGMGRNTRAIISDMNEPLGNAIGNALEVKEAIDTLHGEGPEDFTALVLEAGAIMLQQAKIADTEEKAKSLLRSTIEDGSAFEKFVAFVKAQGGDADAVRQPEKLASARFVTELVAKEEGYIRSIKAMDLGTLAMELGAGRATKEDVINPAVGLVLNKKVGQKVELNDSLVSIHHDLPLSSKWLDELYASFEITREQAKRQALIYAKL
ncbi:MAG: pyrimidine-nucleoside phosphorylase [Firmicutes bacterium GWF2_51_9]|nr:MAG: pyrimidine-nucleoside phosphorylase [Firmicutes bacterium GWF2_51_9]OGS59131.1 MAG: pyrimidine-nucleoside phosphorylase [Firmicutes bacterium GWE2_51_13]HBZ41235.1 pyrimidine-nucleoside phosphorylase [Erysipelotrichaceae bacterium]